MTDALSALDLSYISPEQAEFSLSTVPDHVFRLRPVGLDDQLWLQKTFGEKLQSIFQFCKFDELTRIAYHQLTPEDQLFFVKREVTFVDDEGNKLVKQLGGVALFQSLVIGPTEAFRVVQAVTKAIGVSKPLLDAIEAEEIKKKELTPEQTAPIGESSSTYSGSNTGGPPSKS